MNRSERKIYNPIDPNDSLQPVADQMIADVQAQKMTDEEFETRYWELCGFTIDEGNRINFLSIHLDIPAPILIQHFQALKFEIQPSFLLFTAQQKIDAAESPEAKASAQETYDALNEATLT